MIRGASIATVLASLLAWAGCSSDGGSTDAGCAVPAAPDADVASPWPDGKYISVDEVHARLVAQDPEMLVVNVVDVQYHELGFLPGSLKIPWDTLAGRLGEVDPTRHVVLYCRKGVRSESAYATLVDSAFPFVWVMEGGIERWIAAGFTTVAE